MTPQFSTMRLSLSTGHDAKDLAPHTPTSMSSLTPPVTPIAKDANDPERSIPSPLEDTVSETSASLLNYRAIDTPLRFTDDLEICHGQDGRPVEFGRGAWSIVYKAQSAASPAGPIYTPPSSPIIPSRVFAVKAPLRRDAHQILQAEALTLTRLNLTPGFENHVVPFYGLHSDSKALVMSPIPLALSTYIEDQADLMRRGQSTTLTMFDPVQGVDSWRDMARKLISSLAWLHNTAGIIHGDIKPHNILLRCIPAEESSTEASAFPYEPLLADFSSAFDIPSDSMAKPDPSRTSMSAFTPPFTAPELLSLASLKSGDVAPTSASDVFSLAATLTAAATGDLLLYPGSSSMQRLAMARDGHQILEFTRAGLNGCRVPRKGGVEKLILPAVAKDPTRRISTQDWLVLAST